MKFFGYTCTYNNEKIVKYVMAYVERIGYDKFIVYDNGSTDNTVELLSKYPFVEIRTYGDKESFNESERNNLNVQSIKECWDYIIQHDDELVWMSWTDFDEVIYFSDFLSLRFILDDYHKNGYNVYEKRLINIFPKSGTSFDFTSLYGGMVHTSENAMCSVWNMSGRKPLLIAVNDFEKAYVTNGHHYIELKPIDNKSINFINDNRFHSFHLKYVDKEYTDEENKTFQERGFDLYNCYNKNNYGYEALRSEAFPIKYYFMFNGLSKYYDKNNKEGVQELI